MRARSFRPGIKPAITLLTVLLVTAASTASATVVESLTVSEMTQRSDLVIQATVTSLSSSWDESHRRIYTDVRLSVERYLSGAGPAEVVVRVIGGRVGDSELLVPGQPSFTAGERSILFLEAGPDAGTFVVQCMAAGKYDVTTDVATGETVVTRELSGVTLIDPSTGVVAAPARAIRPLLLRNLAAEVRTAVAAGGGAR